MTEAPPTLLVHTCSYLQVKGWTRVQPLQAYLRLTQRVRHGKVAYLIGAAGVSLSLAGHAVWSLAGLVLVAFL